MINKCPGCGAVIQTLDPKKPGYIREDVYLRNQDDFLCERCFNISHYNKNIKVNITEQDFIDIANNISKQRALIVNIIDVFDLEGTIIKDVNTLFPKSKVLLIANKYDLLSSFSGYTEFGEIHFDPKNNLISPDEISEIVTLLKDGVII